MGEQKNLFIALGLSLVVLVLFDQLVYRPDLERQRAAEQAATGDNRNNAGADGRAATGNGEADGLSPGGSAPDADNAPVAGKKATTRAAGRVRLENPRLEGGIALDGALFDKLQLSRHKVSMEKGADKVQLLRPLEQPGSYYARFGWTADGKGSGFVPGRDSVWTADRDRLIPGEPVTLSWSNGQGLTFQQIIRLDDRFMFTVEQRVVNDSGAPVKLAPFGLVRREGVPETSGLYILHEGAVGALDGELVERTYGDLEDDGTFEVTDTKGGWLGITDKYWMTVLIPDQEQRLARAQMRRITEGGVSHRVNFVQPWQVVDTGGTLSTTSRFYAGAKIVNAIDDYESRYDIPLFDRAIDWGWFYFLTRPIFKGLHFFAELTGNYGVAILTLTLLIKLALFPLANKSYVSMARMKKVQPKMKALQERHKEDKQRLQQEMMALYKKEKVNPMAGCLPILLQIPVFFALYKVLYVTIELRHQPFFGWIQDLSAPDPLTPVNLFGLLPFDPPGFLHIGVWPILMGLSMYLMQRLQPASASMDPAQQKIMRFLPVIFTFVLARFSAGLVIYWTTNNLLSVAQQWIIMRREEARMENK
ncbi:membrane protein insertase YidC [Yunchengibacter salinarum]|uniref:membrane protein insertase YidC n=1 Tax=Yunchengibacter salinarum TaxID=3133399 RepID=UPI0035B5AA9C